MSTKRGGRGHIRILDFHIVSKFREGTVNNLRPDLHFSFQMIVGAVIVTVPVACCADGGQTLSRRPLAALILSVCMTSEIMSEKRGRERKRPRKAGLLSV